MRERRIGKGIVNMKKSVILAGLMLLLSVMVFAGGEDEDNSGSGLSERVSYSKRWHVNIKRELSSVDLVDYSSYDAFYYKNMGKNLISMVFPEGEKPAYAAIRIGDNYFNGFTGNEINVENMATLFEGVESRPKFVAEQDSTDPMEINTVSAVSNWPTELQQSVMQPENSDYSNINVIWYNHVAGSSVEIALFIGDESDSDNKKVKFEASMNTDFFPGESEFFSSYGTGPYKKKAIALMGLMIGGDFSTQTGNRITNLTVAEWNMFSTVDENQRNELIKKLKIAIGQHFAFKYYNEGDKHLPYLEFGKEEFEAIYGADYNIYIKAYLDYCYRKNKPPLAYLVDKYLESFDPNDTEDEPRFNYSYYRYLNSGNAGNWEDTEAGELVKAALRYLTWGVEYTSKRSNMVTVPKTGTNVYSFNKEGIRAWIGELSTLETMNPCFAYYPGYESDDNNLVEYNNSETTVNGTTHTLVLDDDRESSYLAIAGRKKESETVDIQRLEMWSARNLLKNGRSIETIEVDGSTLLAADREKLTDGKLSTICNIQNSIVINLDSAINLKAVTIIAKATGDVDEITITPEGGGGIMDFAKAQLYVSNSAEFCWNKNPLEYPEDIYESYTFLYPDRNNTDSCTIGVDGTGSLEISEIYIYDENPIEYIANQTFYFNWPSLVEYYEVFKRPQVNSDTDSKYDGRFEKVLESMVFNAEPGETKKLYGTGIVVADDECNICGRKTVDGNYSSGNRYDFGLLVPSEIIEIWDNVSGSRYETRRNNGMEGTNWIVDADITFKKDVFLIHIPLDKSINVQEIILYEDGAATAMTDNLRVFTGYNQLLEDVFVNSEQGNPDSLDLPITSPFGTASEPICGNPIPFSWRGIDNPRSFAYKMHNQVLSRNQAENVRPREQNYTSTDTTRALDAGDLEYFQDGYVTSSDVSINNYKPFLPGLREEKDYTFSYLYSNNKDYIPDRVAGVDAAGILAGAMSMTNIYNKFFNLTGESLGEEYRIYLGMQDGGDGLDDGKPLYKANESQSFINGTYRVSWKDIEKMTALVPDMSEIRPGDLIVRYGISDTNNNNEYEDSLNIGIVVGWEDGAIPEYGAGYQGCLEKIYVLTTANTIEAVTLGTWGNGAGMYGGLTCDPKNFQVRRLLVLDNANNKYIIGAKDEWEAIDDSIETLAVDIIFPNDNRTHVAYNMDHWIPNTNEIHALGEIEIGRSTGYGVMALNDTKRDIVLLSPADMYYKADSDTATEGNIYNNAGTTFEFYAMKNENDRESKRIATFNLVSDERTRETSYRITYNSQYFYNAANIKGKGINDETWLKVDKNNSNKLTAKLGNEFYTVFGIKAVGDNIRAGDDLLLRFGLLDDNQVTGEVVPGDFVAVYDKKMLWRANLYIEETGRDWNDEHPWIEGNEWNKDLAGNTGNGGQVLDIPKWSRYQDGENRENTVTYCWGGWESVFDFCNELEEQKRLLNECILNGFEGYNQNVAGWDQTIAPINKENIASAADPGTRWLNYIFPNSYQAYMNGDIVVKTPAGITTAAVAPALGVDDEMKDQFYYYENKTISNINQTPASSEGMTPSVPGLADYHRFYGEMETSDIYKYTNSDGELVTHKEANWYESNITKYSSGLDCSGFVQRCQAYNNSPYRLSSFTSKKSPNRYSYSFGNYPDAVADGDDDEETVGPPHIIGLVPGDILHMSGHWCIVLNIEYKPGTRTLKGTDDDDKKIYMKSVKLIESCWVTGDSIVREVYNKQTLHTYKNKDGLYFKRLKVGQ